MNTNYFRDHEGWNGKTTIDIEDGRQLVIRTSKRAIGGGLATNATVWHIAGDGVRRHAMGFGLGNGDYSERLVLSQHARITEKLVRAQHEATLARITSIRDDVRDYYAAQERRAQAQHEQECPRRFKFDPPCRFKSDPGSEASHRVTGCAQLYLLRLLFG